MAGSATARLLVAGGGRDPLRVVVSGDGGHRGEVVPESGRSVDPMVDSWGF